MTSTPEPSFTELDRLNARFSTLEERLHAARDGLKEAVVRHLRERNARPGVIADHTPWDRVWVSQLGREAGVPPVKGPNAVGPPPTYAPDVQAAATAELDKLSGAYRRAEKGLEELVAPIHEEIRRLYQEGVTPKQIAQHTPYDPNWVGQIGRGTEAAKGPRASGRQASARRKAAPRTAGK